ncbi:MAG TPA: PA14 domain-containing protein [Cytophagales bacterium]|nr:PA14 domain-containing protein [Cytophagales bacterium]
MRIISLTLISIILLSTFSCNLSKKPEAPERPREAWVIRSVLDKKPRMISIALSDKLWIAYNTQTASLYKAWTGGINFDGPVYTSAHGPQPTSQGITYFEQPDSVQFILIKNGAEMPAEVIYKGHTILDNKVTLKYELKNEGQNIVVEETPEVLPKEGDQVGFERVFTLANVPAGVQVGIKMNLNSMPEANAFTTDGKFNVSRSSDQSLENKTFYSAEGTLVLNNNDETNFSVTLIPMPVKVTAEKLAGEAAVMELMAKSDCNTCHNKDVKTVGPAYMEIAKRYGSTENIRNELVAKVIKGGAGNWGQVPMTPHPTLSKEDAGTMVSYILALDADQEVKKTSKPSVPKLDYEIEFKAIAPGTIDPQEEKKGIALNIYQFSEAIKDFPEINGEMLPVSSGSINALHADDNGFGELKNNFAIHATGFINIKKETNIVFRLVSDDGALLFIDDKLIVDNGGSHPMEPKDGEIILKKGKHPFKIEYFQGEGGKGLSLQWLPYGAKEFTVIPPDVFTFKGTAIQKTQAVPLDAGKQAAPGDGAPLEAVHPSFDLAQARPDDFKPKVAGLDFLPDGRMVVTTWDSLGSVYLLEGVQGKDPGAIKVKRIAFGLAEPLGVKVVDNEIYVLQKQELTKLVDLNEDDIIDEYQTICNGWKVSANFHEFAFGLVYKDGYFYGTLATAINPGGASTQPQIPDRGKVVKISKQDGTFSLIASGLRTPNGIGFGVDNEIFIADNQGDWLPASKIVHLIEGAWYGSRSVDFKGTEGLTETQPVVWLPQDEIGNSPTQPAVLNVGPYKNQMIHGDVTHGGIKRVFAEKVNGAYQGVVFRFTQGMEAGINRLVWGPDGALYAGGIGSTGNWQHLGKLGYGLQRLTYNNKPAFEMLAVRAKPNGIEIEFTEPIKQGAGENTKDYNIRQWMYKPTAEYGGPKINEEGLSIKNITLSEDRKKVFLELKGMKPKHLVYIRLNKNTMISDGGQTLWTTEGWYTMNNIPAK